MWPCGLVSVLQQTAVWLTHGDELTDSIEQTLKEAGPDLKHLIKSCGGRYHVFNNTQICDREQVLEFLDKVDDMLPENGDKHYTSDMFEHVEEMLKKREEELRKEYGQMIQELIDTFAKEKTRLEKNIRQLKESGQTKDQRIKELQEKLREKDRYYKESVRFYELKRKTVRREVEETQVDENIPEISRKLRKLRV
ncbi:GTPase IMAP family member 9-like [Pseudorasbora parva]|uniref:GTPase IMAP family member 9-like n=1 Tax=Pseudorasbora parva TaxID=51549 RepID=UPI00351DDC50